MTAGLTVLALGAGRQSTTLALLAVEGVLPRPDAAIFADTGWEPRAVYEHLDRLERVLTGAGIPLYRVARGNLPDDVLDPLRHATIPAFTLAPEGTTRDPIKATCPVCAGDWQGFGPDGCEECGHDGWIIVGYGPERPLTVSERSGAIARRCTGRYKVEPIERQVRLLLGARSRDIPCRYCDASGVRRPPWDLDSVGPCSVCRGTGTRTLVGPVPAGAHAEQWIGFAAEEILLRRNDSRFPAYITPTYPLEELKMTTADCLRWLAARGWTSVAKSACVGCPFHGNAHWRRMRDEQPEDWQAAVEFDRAFRTGHGLDGQRFLHASRLPLDLAPIDRVTPSEWAARQGDIFDVVEEGDPDGCGPYSCRSGAAGVAAS